MASSTANSTANPAANANPSANANPNPSANANPNPSANPTSIELDKRKLMSVVYTFRTKMSESINPDIALKSLGVLDRLAALSKLSKHVPMHISTEIEAGLFEFTLIKLSEDPNATMEFLQRIYDTQLHNLLCNLDVSNQRIQNKTLRPGVLNNTIVPFYLAFMRPEQLHPVRWMPEIMKRKKLEEYSSSMKVTDIYTCYRCRNKKCITSQIQMRGADEPMTIFVTCLVCYNTFTK